MGARSGKQFALCWLNRVVATLVASILMVLHAKSWEIKAEFGDVEQSSQLTLLALADCSSVPITVNGRII